MAVHKKFYKGLAFWLTLIALGLFTGKIARNAYNEYTSIITDMTAVESKAAEPPTTTLNFNLYKVSPPSQGRANITIPVTIENIFGSKAFVLLPQQEGNLIKKGQKIFLYNQQEDLMKTIGIVSKTKQHTDENIIVHINFTPLPNGEMPAPHRGNIITDEIEQAYRLPLTSLQKDSSGQSYIWEIERVGTDKGKVIRRTLENLKISQHGYFVMPRPAEYISNIYILNPDDTLAEGQIISIMENPYSPGPQPSAQEIADTPATIQEDTPEIYGLQSTTDPACGNSYSSVCGNEGAADDFINRMKDMAADSQK